MNEHTNKVVAEIAAERERQQSVEGWTPEHDDEHAKHEIAFASMAYIKSAVGWTPGIARHTWPWGWETFKPKDERRDLIRAAALIVAEIERLDRAALRGEEASRG